MSGRRSKSFLTSLSNKMTENTSKMRDNTLTLNNKHIKTINTLNNKKNQKCIKDKMRENTQ